ncbi:hypothetical protein NY751_14180 [Xanthomonas campestris]|uniref:hypothetical protein n=1 Tax=Xanthomonas campestris TaxID=339 RepID=UPI002359538E|nr:hypothetical protein [Xanthomonas campestris]MDC8747205.1 hypothetical protein [Xanthomonas campestris]
MTLSVSLPEPRADAALAAAAATAAAQAERIAHSEAARPALRSVRLPAALEQLERAARAEVRAMQHPRRSCSEEELLFATVAWDMGLDGAAIGVSAR